MLCILQPPFKQQWEDAAMNQRGATNHKQYQHPEEASVFVLSRRHSLTLLFFCFPPSLLPEQNKLGEVGQEISAQKQKQSNMKSSGVCQGGGAEGPGSVGKRERERVSKLSLHYQQHAHTHTHKHTYSSTHTHTRAHVITHSMSDFSFQTNDFHLCQVQLAL